MSAEFTLAASDQKQPLNEVKTLSEDSAPEPGLAKPTLSEPAIKAKTQRALAYWSLAVVVIFYGVVLVLRATGVFTQADLTGVISSVSVIPTLASVAFAFYFATSPGK